MVDLQNARTWSLRTCWGGQAGNQKFGRSQYNLPNRFFSMFSHYNGTEIEGLEEEKMAVRASIRELPHINHLPV